MALLGPIASTLWALGGALLYFGIFNSGEFHMMGTKFLQLLFATYVMGTLHLVLFDEKELGESALKMLATQGCFLGGIYSSLLVWRLFLNPLNKIPGPYLAKLSSWWYTFQLGNGDAYRVLDELHQKYGDFVRVGSNNVSITHPDAMIKIYGSESKCTKGPWYELAKPNTSLHTEQDRAEHDKRRRIWSPAFSNKALRGYEERIAPLNEKLVDQIRAFGGQPVNVSKWFNYYSYDVMGDLAWGRSFDMLENGKDHWAIQLLNEGMALLAYNLPSWFGRLLISIPGLAKGHWRFIEYCSSQLDNRITHPPEIPDVIAALLAPLKGERPYGQDLSDMQGDSRLLIVAGSDTTAATLTHLFYHLAQDPTQVERLRKELTPFITADGDFANFDIQNCEHLNGCINEALRLHPPVPTAVHRQTPSEGLTIGETFIPGGTDIWAPQYVLHRREDAFKNALTFYPERWYSDPSALANKTAFAPFLIGPYSCIGKPLALLELRTVTTKLIMAFDVALAPGEDGNDLLHKTHDHFTLGLGKLDLIFKPRKAS